MLKTLLTITALIAAGTAAVAHDRTETNHRYTVDWTFNGDNVIVDNKSGALGLRQGEEIIGYFGGGKPRVVGFGCEGSTGVMIAMEEDLLPRCKQIEAISY